MTLNDIASRLRVGKQITYKGQRGVSACCPAHNDQNPSMRVWEGNDGWIHVKCFAGCTEESIMASIGLTNDDRRIDQSARIPKDTSDGKTIYQYFDHEGLEAWIKVRFLRKDQTKSFIQYVRFDAEGKTLAKIVDPKTGKERYLYPSEANLGDRGKILYHAKEVDTRASQGGVIYVCEGEKAVEAFRLRGHVATCQCAGAGPGKWKPEHTAALKGALVVIVADRDEVGEQYAKEVAAALVGVAKTVRVVQSATTNLHDDAYDHFDAKKTVEEFVRRPDLEPVRNISKLKSASDVQTRAVDWFLFPYFAFSTLSLIEADPGVGKSMLACALATAASRGVHLPIGIAPIRKVKCLLYMTEDVDEITTVPRLRAMGADMSMITLVDEVVPLNRKGLDRIKNDILETGAELVIYDPITAFLDAILQSARPELDAHSIMGEIALMAAETKAAVIGIRHLRKSSDQDTNAIYQGIGSISIIGKARNAIQVRKDKNSPFGRIVSHIKANIGVHGQSFRYDIVGNPEDPEAMPEFLWHGFVDQDSVATATNAVKERQNQKIGQCEQKIREYLDCPNGIVEVSFLRKQLEEAGFADSTIRRALENITRYKRIGKQNYRELIDPFED